MLTDFNALAAFELERFRSFLMSPYHNNNKMLLRLFEYLISLFPDITSENVSQKELKRILYKRKPCSPEIIRKLISDFNKAFEKFLWLEQSQINDCENDITLLQSLNRRQLLKTYEKVIKRAEESMKKRFMRNQDAILCDIYIDKEYYFSDFLKWREHDTPDRIFNTPAKIEDLVLVMTLNTIYRLFAKSIFKDTKILGSIKGWEEIFSRIKNNSAYYKKNIPHAYMYYNIMMAYHTLKYSHFKNIKNFVDKNEFRLRRDDLKTFYKHMYTYYYYRYKQTLNPADRKQAFEIYKKAVSKGFVPSTDYMMDDEFYVMVRFGLKLNDIDWIGWFIENFSRRLNESFREQMYSLAKGCLYFYKKEFDKIFECMNHVDYKFRRYYFYSRELLAMTHYELKQFDAIEHLLDSYKKFISRNEYLKTHKYHDTHIKSAEQFIKYMTHLLKATSLTGKDKMSELGYIKKILDKDKEMTGENKDWFYLKVKS